MKSRRKSPVNLITTEPHNCSIHLRLNILSRLPFFESLSPEEMEAVNQHFVDVGYEAGETVYLAGDPAERLFVVADGKVKLMQHGLNGRNVLLDILTSGEFFGNLAALGAAVYSDTARAQIHSCILSVRSDSFRQILNDHPELAFKSLQIMAQRLEAANQRVLQLSSMPLEKRIAVTLLQLARKISRPVEDLLVINTPLSRDELAEMTGATPETVSRVMSQLQNQGVIESGRQWVGVSDLKALEGLAAEE